MGQKMPIVRIDLTSVPDKFVWYTVVTKYNYEKKFASDLQAGLKNSGMEDYISEIVVPIIETEYIVKSANGKDRKTTKVEKIYPLYVFVKARMNEKVWDYLRNTTGAATVLAASGIPSYMEDHDMNKIKAVCGILEKEEAAKKISAKSFEGKVGDKVKANSGVFEGFEGTIKSIDMNKLKSVVRLDVNGAPVEFNLGDLQLI